VTNGKELALLEYPQRARGGEAHVESGRPRFSPQVGKAVRADLDLAAEMREERGDRRLFSRYRGRRTKSFGSSKLIEHQPTKYGARIC